MITNILLGLVCFVALTLTLVLFQFGVTFLQFEEDAKLDLQNVKDTLDNSQNLDELSQYYDDYYKRIAQQAVLLLENEEISSEKLAAVAEVLGRGDSYFVFQEDGKLLYSYLGEAFDVSQNFLSELADVRTIINDDGYAFYAIPIVEEQFLAIATYIGMGEENLSNTGLDTYLLADIEYGLTGNLLIADTQKGRFVYSPPSLKGKKLDDHLFSIEESGIPVNFAVIDDEMVLAYSQKYQDHYVLYSYRTLKDLAGNFNSSILLALFGFGFLICLLLAYAEFLIEDIRTGRLGSVHYVQISQKRYVNTLLLRKLSGFAMIGITCMFCVVYCSQLLVRSDEERKKAEDRLNIAVSQLTDNHQLQSKAEHFLVDNLVYSVQELRNILEFKPSLCNEKDLSSLARIFGADSIYILDETGKTVVSSEPDHDYALSNDPDDETYPFWDVVNGFSESHVLRVSSDSNGQQKEIAYVGIPAEDQRGMIQVGFGAELHINMNSTANLEQVMSKVVASMHSTILAVQNSTGKCIYSSDSQYTGQPIADYGMSEKYLRNGYSGTHQFDGEECLINTVAVLDMMLVSVMPTTWIASYSWFFTILVIIVSLFVVTLCLLPVLFVHTPGEDIQPKPEKPVKLSKRTHMDAALSEDGKIVLAKNETERYSVRKHWKEQKAGDKLRSLISILAGIVSVYLLISLMQVRISGMNPMLERILQRNWDRTINVYAIVYVAIVITGIWLGSKILQKLTRFVTGTFSRRWTTTGILISNVIRYAAFIASIFITLQTFGVETSALITSASVLTLVFGLGSQSFVADLIAGVFLIFEGTFRVGDIVTIDGWRGEVVEIGLRATKVKNPLGNVKIFQNSRISGAINMTSDQTYAVCDVALPQGVKLEDYEQKLVSSFFPKAQADIPDMKQQLAYEGVVSVSGAGATLRISVRCLEAEREQLQRELYRSLKLWQEQNA